MAATCQLLAATMGPGQAVSRKGPKMVTEPAGAPVALVTGAEKSIGLETARRLAGAG
jgi:hypothetical protein